jgi:riboflavin kinase/FMN adenylyltransferase
MKLIDRIENLTEKFPYPVVTIGNFDGVHLGHQAIFRRLSDRAKKKNGTSIVFTFEPHPLKVIAPARAPKLLTTFKDKVNRIKTFGIDVLICANFTKEFAEMQAEDFVKKVLLNAVGVKEIFVGSNYFFGKGRRGSPVLLKELGEKYGFKTAIIPEIKIENVIPSSSRIRTLVAKGKVEEASVFLGRYYSIEGVVIEGTKRGKRLFNMPTANVAAVNELFPKDGVYAVTVDLDGKIYGGAANIGCNPTFEDKKFSFEVHILEFDGELLGETLHVNFIKRIRDEMRFSKVDDLAFQMKKDIEEIRQILSMKVS